MLLLLFHGNGVTSNKYTYTPTGSTIKIAGTDAIKKKFAWPASGQIIKISGAITASNKFVYTANGAIKIAGLGSQAKKFVYVVSGVEKISGIAITAKQSKFTYNSLGTMHIFGASVPLNKWVYVSSGTAKIAGANNYKKKLVWVASGLEKISGIATTAKLTQFAYHSSGTILISGTSAIINKWSYVSSGRMSLGVSVIPYSVTQKITPTGQRINVSGAATTSKSSVRIYTPSGRIKVAATVTAKLVLKYVPIGKVFIAGSGNLVLRKVYKPLGIRISVSGIPNRSKIFKFQLLTEPRISLFGISHVSKQFSYFPHGCITASGIPKIIKKLGYGASGIVLVGNSTKNYLQSHGKIAPVSGTVHFSGGGLYSKQKAPYLDGWVTVAGVTAPVKSITYIAQGALSVANTKAPVSVTMNYQVKLSRRLYLSTVVYSVHYSPLEYSNAYRSGAYGYTKTDGHVSNTINAITTSDHQKIGQRPLASSVVSNNFVGQAHFANDLKPGGIVKQSGTISPTGRVDIVKVKINR